MTLIARMFHSELEAQRDAAGAIYDSGLESQRGTAGAMYDDRPRVQWGKSGCVCDGGPPGARVFSHRGCQSEALQELVQDLGFGMDKPTPVQVALHRYFSLSSRIEHAEKRPL